MSGKLREVHETLLEPSLLPSFHRCGNSLWSVMWYPEAAEEAEEPESGCLASRARALPEHHAPSEDSPPETAAWGADKEKKTQESNTWAIWCHPRVAREQAGLVGGASPSPGWRGQAGGAVKEGGLGQEPGPASPGGRGGWAGCPVTLAPLLWTTPGEQQGWLPGHQHTDARTRRRSVVSNSSRPHGL